MLTISGLTYRIGGRALLNEASAQIPAGGKVGLVGRNGAGKSTLLDLIRGALQPDAGDIQMPRGHRLGFLAQEAPSGERNPLDTVLAADTERAALLVELDHGAAPLHLDNGKIALYSGGFDAFLRARREAPARQAALAQRQQRERERLQRFIDRFRYKASKARQAQSRVKALARLEPVALIADTAPVTLRLPQPAGLSPPLISLDRVSTRYVPDKPILSRLDLRLDPDDRIALLGANGNGKTTFARLLAGRLEPFSGQMIRAPKLTCGFFAQHQIEEMQPAESAFGHLAALMPDSPPEAVRARLGGFGFSQDKAFVPVGELSGGERARLNLALVTYDAPELLILDEPTNHLDMETREALVTALAEYAGAVVLVSHDWHLVELIAERLWLVENGTVQPFEDDP